MTFALPRHQYLRTVRRPYPPFYASLIFTGSANPKHYYFALKKPSTVRNIIVCDGVWYYVARELRACGRAAFREWNSAQIIARVQRAFVQREQELMRATKTNLHTYVKAYERYMPALQTIWNLDSFVAAAVRHAMHRKFHAPAVEELMDTLNIPLQNNFYKQEECDLLNTRDLHAHVRKYDWIHSRYGEVRPYTIAEARAKRAGMDKTALIAGWRKEKRKVRRAIRDAKRMLGSRAYLIDLLQFIIYYRTQRTDIINKSSYLFAPKLARFAHARGLTYDQMLHCTKDEVLQGAPSRTILNARIRHHATIIDRGGVSVLAGKDYDRIKAFVDKDVARVNRFSGSVASPGRVTGIVKIILGRDDFSKIKKGDILVAGMTTPQMLPIMKKAGAFVTDEGGITCHAAIISRELKKPCIIGTKVATRVLKDGDRVEVDAERGIVRRL